MTEERDRWQTTTWLAGLLVAAGACVATAHGLYKVAEGAGVSPGVAWLYPLITDGLALVAYAATARLDGGGRRWAAFIVVLAAGLSGLAQAVYLAGGIGAGEPAELRFGVGAWPAVACALAAHLVHLVSRRATPDRARPDERANGPAMDQAKPVEAGQANGPAGGDVAAAVPVVEHQAKPGQDQASRVDAGQDVEDTRSPRERARDWALLRQLATGELPTVREVAAEARVGRETAGKALQELKAASNGHSADTEVHLVTP
jgi:hypothetical protein